MPNMCNGFITIKNPSTELFNYLTALPTPDSLEAFALPMPQEVLDDLNLPHGESKNLRYNRCINNRGSKRGTCDLEVERSESDHEIKLTFRTARSPIKEEVLEQLSQSCSNLYYAFYESGECYSGIREYQDGELVFLEDYDDDNYGEGRDDEDEDFNLVSTLPISSTLS